jgi:tetratricopeptide (TPR) repeat protein
MASFYEQMGMTKQQTEVLERSLQIFERLMREDPNQDWNAFDATISYDTLGEVGRETEPDPSKIYRNYELARQLRQRLTETVHQEQPSRAGRVRSLAVSDIKLSALALELHDPARALEYAQQAVSTSLILADPKTSAVEDRELLAGSYNVLARTQVLMSQEEPARESYRQVELLRSEWVHSEPLNAYATQELARAYFDMGTMELEVGNIKASLDQYRHAENMFVELVAKDKANVELKWYLANTEYALGNARQAAGMPDEAKAYFRRCRVTREGLFRMDPANIQRRIELMLVNAQLGNAEQALKDASFVEQYAPRNPGKLFPAACAYALSAKASNVPGRAESYTNNAIRLLRMAIESGFRDSWALQHDPGLEAVRSRSDYKQLVSEARRIS